MPPCARSGWRCSRRTSTTRSSRTSWRASGSAPSAHDVLESVNAGQQVVKIVHDELTALLGAGDRTFRLIGNPAVVMLVGLQGSGKTTIAAKLARHIVKQGRRPLLVAADPYRPAAADQLADARQGASTSRSTARRPGTHGASTSCASGVDAAQRRRPRRRHPRHRRPPHASTRRSWPRSATRAAVKPSRDAARRRRDGRPGGRRGRRGVRRTPCRSPA